jgi:hypothetical protein
MNATTTALTALFDRIPRRYSIENIKDINSIVQEYENVLMKIEAENSFYEKNVSTYFNDLDTVRSSIKKSTDNKASKKNKDNFFDDASVALKDSIESLITMYADGSKKA